jgi:hypothetical protein
MGASNTIAGITKIMKAATLESGSDAPILRYPLM